MGIENRDYARGPSPRSAGWSGGGGGSVFSTLLVANIVVYLLQNGMSQTTMWLDLNLADIERFELWRLLTYGFCHSLADPMHLAFNMFVLWMFGRFVEPLLGSREYVLFYLAGILVSGLGHLLYQAVSGSPDGAIGASGGVNAVVFLAALTYPQMKVLVFFVIPMPLITMAVLFALVDALGMLGGGSGIANAAHLAGAAFGAAYQHYHWRILPTWRRLEEKIRFRRKSMGRRSFRVVRPEEPAEDMTSSLEEQVDAILDKIHREGEASLSDRERQILKDASQRYRNRT